MPADFVLQWLRKLWRAKVVMLVLAGCAAETQAPVVIPPPLAVPLAPLQPQTPQSAAAQQYYQRVQQMLLAQGLLRTDGGVRDAPVTERILAENFLRIALYDEYHRSASGTVQRQTASELRRWQAPVRVGLRFGASVSPGQRATDTARVASYLARLSQVTGHPIGLSDNAANFFVYIVSEDERRALGPVMLQALPQLTATDVAGVTAMHASTFCIVYAQSAGSSGVYTRAFAVVRAEHPDLLRLSCLHEEIAQGLGLANDSQNARASIFNDDEEFALLTPQDEMMLRMLYDPALRPGMTEAQARPIVYDLAGRLAGGES